MQRRYILLALFTAATFATGFLLALPCSGQMVLYDNGQDGNDGYYHVNFGSAVTNPFVLSRPASVNGVTLTLYDVDDRNDPQHLKWTITTDPFGGSIKATGFVGLSRLQAPYLTRFFFFAWKMGFTIPSLELPAGTYYLQIQDVVTRWDTWAFWAQSSNGDAAGYYKAVGQSGYGTVSPIPSESFAVSGQWMSEQTH